MTLQQFLTTVADVSAVSLRMAMVSAIADLTPAYSTCRTSLDTGSYGHFYHSVLRRLADPSRAAAFRS